VRDVVINLSWHGERIREAFGGGASLGLEISYSEEGPSLSAPAADCSPPCHFSAMRASSS
jgi:NDP-sugar pyrophosphorylase family protein